MTVLRMDNLVLSATKVGLSRRVALIQIKKMINCSLSGPRQLCKVSLTTCQFKV